MSIRALTTLIGKAGTGKSTKLLEIASRCRRAIIADPEGIWEPRRGDVVVERWDRLLDYLEEIEAEDPEVPFRIVYRDRPEPMMHAAGGAAFATKNCTLIVDEVAWLCTPTYIPTPLKHAIIFGRRYRINLLVTTREPQEIHNLFFSQATSLHFFRVDPGLGLDRIRRNYREIADVLPTLNEFPPPLDFRTFGNPKLEALFGQEGLDQSREEVLRSSRNA